VFSIFLRDALTMAWPVVQSAAKKGSIKFLIEISDPAEKEALLSVSFEVKPAGDIDFVEKQQRISNLQQDMPLFQGQPIGQEMLKEYIRLRYPEKYDQWSKVMNQGNDMQLIQGLAQALQTQQHRQNGQWSRVQWALIAGLISAVAWSVNHWLI
jgi:hypothetical protein